MTATTSKNVLSATIADDRIELRCPYNAVTKEFIQSLPSARWMQSAMCWRVDATPGCAWRIFNDAPEYLHVEADEEIHELSQQLIGSSVESFEQPPIRVMDAWRHQAGAYNFACERPATMLAAAMGVGKTKITVDLMVNQNCRTVLVLCPLSVLGVWRREFNKHAPVVFDVLILDKGTSANKAAKTLMHLTQCKARRQPAVIVVNYETAKTPAMMKVLTKTEWDAVIADESHRIKSANSATSKAAYKIGRKAKRRLTLTGTPMSNGPLDVFGQFRFLDPGIYGTSYHRFRNTYAISGPFGADHIVGYRNQADFAKKMALITYEVGSDVLDLPPATHSVRTITLDKKSRKAYDALRDEMISYLETITVVAANALTKVLRLQQMTSGYAATDEHTEVIGSEKSDMLRDILSDVNEPVCVCCKFRHDLDRVEAVANELKRNYGEISGRRKDLTENATMPGDIDIMGVQISAGGLGIDLTRACLAINYSVGYSLSDYEQWLARMHRPGQTRPVRYINLVVEDSVDEAVYRAIEKKQDIVAEVRDYLRVAKEMG